MTTSPSPSLGHRTIMAAALGGQPEGAKAAAALVDRADQPVGDGRWWRYLLWPGLVVIFGMVGMLAGGIEVWRAALIAGGVATSLWTAIVSFEVRKTMWHGDAPGVRYRTGTPWEVPGLSTARESDQAFQQYLRPRLWALAQQLLLRSGIDPESDRARKIVGAREYALLTGAETDPRRTTSSVSALSLTIARLAVEPIDGAEPVVNTPALAGLAGAVQRHDHQTTSLTTEGDHR